MRGFHFEDRVMARNRGRQNLASQREGGLSLSSPYSLGQLSGTNSNPPRAWPTVLLFRRLHLSPKEDTLMSISARL